LGLTVLHSIVEIGSIVWVKMGREIHMIMWPFYHH